MGKTTKDQDGSNMKYESLGFYIREKRELKKKYLKEYGLRQFAKRLGISAGYLSKFERGKSPSPSESMILKFANDLGEDYDVLLGKAGKIPPRLKKIILERVKLFSELIIMSNKLSDDTILNIIKTNQE